LSDYLSILNIDDLLLNVVCLLKHSILDLNESIDGLLALLDVLSDGEGEPVVVEVTFVHPLIKLLDLLFKELLLDWLKVAKSDVVTSQELVELVNVSGIVFLLKGDVNDGLRNTLSNSIEELGLSDDYLKKWVELDGVDHVVLYLLSVKDVLLEEFYCLLGVLFLPLLEDLLLVVLVEIFGKGDVFESNTLEGLGLKLVCLALELSDWSLDSSHDRSSPSD